jgi:AcrR family transcriptional regulator
MLTLYTYYPRSQPLLEGTTLPRLPDPDLEEEILDAAQKLWKKGGEKALTMRAVAKAAGTNTPSVYRRFRDRDAILRGLLQRIRLEFAALLQGASSVEEGCERYLDHALSHPREYELFYQKEHELFHSARSVQRPGRDAIQRKLVERFGGSGADQSQRQLALWMVAHGAAMLLIAKTLLPAEANEARKVFTRTVQTLLREWRSQQ